MLPVRRWETVSWRRVLHAFSLRRFHGPWRSPSWPKGSSNLNEMVGLQALLLCMMKPGSWHGTRKRSCRGQQATACAWMLWLFWYVRAKQRDFPLIEIGNQRIGCPRVLHQQPLALSKPTEWRSMSLYGQLWQMPLLKIPACTLYLAVQILATQRWSWRWRSLTTSLPWQGCLSEDPQRSSFTRRLYLSHASDHSLGQCGPQLCTCGSAGGTLFWLQHWGRIDGWKLEQFIKIRLVTLILDSPPKTNICIEIHYWQSICMCIPSSSVLIVPVMAILIPTKKKHPHRTLSHHIFLRRHCRSPTWNWEQLWFQHKSSTIQPSQ